MSDTTQGAAASGAPDIRLAEPRFLDWLVCGDIQRQTIINPRATSGEVAVEMRVNAYAVARWIERLSSMTTEELRRVSYDRMRTVLSELRTLVPPFDGAHRDGSETDNGHEVVISLTRPLPGHRGDITSVAMKRPQFGDWVDCGDVMIQRALEPEGNAQPSALEYKADERAVAKWMCRLSGLDIAALGQMSYADARRVYAVLRSLLAEIDLGNSPAPQMSSGSTAASHRPTSNA